MRLATTLFILAAPGLWAADAQPAATPDEYSVRIRALEADIRSLVDEQARDAGPAGAAASADYAAAKAKASDDVRRRLQFVEYHLADNDYNRAIDTCNAILKDHPHEPATVRLKYRILMSMVERERALLARERQYRAEEGLADAQARGVLPKDGPKIARTVWVFDEDVAESDRAAVRQRLQAKVTFSYDGVAVGEVLKPLFAIAGINYVILDRALSSETLTIHLVNDTVENALSTIAKLVEVRYNYSANTVFIGAADSEVMVSEIIRLSSGLTDVQTEVQLPQPLGGGGGENGPVVPNMGQNQQQAGQQGGEQKSDLERFLEKVPEIVSGWPSDGKLFLEKKSNTLYVRATPAAIAELRRLLRAMDYQSAQILIEAKFVAVLDGSEKSLGIDWGAAALGETISVTGITGSVFGSAVGGAGATASPATAGAGGLLAQVLYSPKGPTNPGIFAAISALEKDNKAQVLTEPRILTINNSVGNIALTRSYTYTSSYDVSQQSTGVTTPTDSNGTINNGTSVTTPIFNPQTTTVQLGYTLRIRPSIARNDDVITLDLRPTVTDLSGENTKQRVEYVPAANQDPRSFEYEVPGFLSRTLATTMHVKNGQTVVLGGLTLEEYQNSQSGVPGVSRVPVLGNLFGVKRDKVVRSNLLLFVTAHIIDPSGVKIGAEVRRLKDTASVVLPEELRIAEAEMRATEVQRTVDAAAKVAETEKTKPAPPPTGKTGARR